MARNGIVVVRTGDIERVTLDNGTANTFDLATAESFGAAMHQAVADGVRVVVLSGGERFFSAGGDLRSMRDAVDSAYYVRSVADALHGGLHALAESDTLLIVSIRGIVAGAGLGVVLHADVSVCSEEATFRAGYGAAGLTPDMGLSYLLPRAIGEPRARQLLLVGEPVSASTALSWGLINEVVQTVELASRVDAIAATLAASPAANATKVLLRAGREARLAAQLDAEADSIARLFGTPDVQGRVAAFLDR